MGSLSGPVFASQKLCKSYIEGRSDYFEGVLICLCVCARARGYCLFVFVCVCVRVVHVIPWKQSERRQPLGLFGES